MILPLSFNTPIATATFVCHESDEVGIEPSDKRPLFDLAGVLGKLFGNRKTRYAAEIDGWRLNFFR